MKDEEVGRFQTFISAMTTIATGQSRDKDFVKMAEKDLKDLHDFLGKQHSCAVQPEEVQRAIEYHESTIKTLDARISELTEVMLKHPFDKMPYAKEGLEDWRPHEIKRHENTLSIMKTSITAIRQMQGWIPVSERLPKEAEKMDRVFDPLTFAVVDAEYHMVSDLVSVCVKDEDGNRFVCDDVLVDGKWSSFPYPEWEVTHWMPLPPPPCVESDGK